jgi:predicted MFS family arabinose efflux permease
MLSFAPRSARVAVATLFFVNGSLFAGWVTRVPEVRDRIGAGDAELGLALLGVAAGSMVAMPVAGWACERWSGRAVAVAGGLAACASIPLPAFAPDVAGLALALGLIGATFGTLDVAMNVEAIAVERAYGRPIMPSFHGWFSTGGLAGALAGGALVAAGMGAAAHLVATAAAGAAAVGWAARHQMHAGDRPPPSATTLRLATGADPHAPPRRTAGAPARVSALLLVCGLIAFCAALGEGAMADWSALYLTDLLGASGGLAAMGYAAFAGAMAAGRFAGERAIRALGPAGTLQLGCGAASVAMATGLAASDPAAAIAAFAVAGLGVACVFPVVLSAAGGADPGRGGPAVAFVSTIGYTGFLTGLPVIGFVAQHTSLSWGLGVVALLAAVAAVLAAGLRSRRPGVSASESRRARDRRATTRRRTPSGRGA